MSRPAFNTERAEAEGWSVFRVGDAWQVQRCDEAGVFSRDERAWSHVVARAREGSHYHRNALLFIRQFSPEEWVHISDCCDTSFLT